MGSKKSVSPSQIPPTRSSSAAPTGYSRVVDILKECDKCVLEAGGTLVAWVTEDQLDYLSNQMVETRECVEELLASLSEKDIFFEADQSADSFVVPAMRCWV